MQPTVHKGRQLTASNVRNIKHGDTVEIYRMIHGKPVKTHEGVVDGFPWTEEVNRAASWYIALQGRIEPYRIGRSRGGYNPAAIDITGCHVLIANT